MKIRPTEREWKETAGTVVPHSLSDARHILTSLEEKRDFLRILEQGGAVRDKNLVSVRSKIDSAINELESIIKELG